LREAALVRALSARIPQVTPLRVKDALDAINGVIGELAVAVRAASSVAFLFNGSGRRR
jgi:putative ABC transport system permease protein